MAKKEVKNGWNWRDSVFVLVAFVVISGMLYFAWDVATARVSMEGKCVVHQIDYVNLTGNGSCIFPLVQGDVSICALPRDIDCSGLVTDVSLMKVLMSGRGK
jgi:hypothetical protein